MKYYKNLTYNMDITFNQVCLFNTQVKTLYKRVEAIFSEHMLKIYTTATALLDIFLLTYTLFTLNLAKPQSIE